MCAFWTADAKTSRTSTSKDLQTLIQASESRVRTYAAAKSVRRLHDTLESIHTQFTSSDAICYCDPQLVRLDDSESAEATVLSQADKLLQKAREERLRNVERWAKHLGAVRRTAPPAPAEDEATSTQQQNVQVNLPASDAIDPLLAAIDAAGKIRSVFEL